MADVTLSDLKEKFATVQSIGQDLKEQKIRLDSEKEALERQYQSKMEEVLAKTGAQTHEQAIQVFQELDARLKTEVQELDKQLSAYLDSYGEGSEGES